METHPKIHHLLILDSTQSFHSATLSTMEVFNELKNALKSLDTLFNEQHHFISLVSYNGLDKPLVHFLDYANIVEDECEQKMVSDTFAPTLKTDILRLLGAVKGQSDYNVLVTMLKDPKNYTGLGCVGPAIQKVVDELEVKYWAFTYIDTDVAHSIGSLSVVHATNFSKHQTDMHGVFLQEMDSSSLYIDKIQFERDHLDGFTSIPEEY